MTLHLTIATVELTYDRLRTTLPFRKWGLPDSDDIEFNISTRRDCMGWFRGAGSADHHEIGLSFSKIGSLATLDRVMAHEMIHLKQEVAKTTTANTEHNAEFYVLAAKVARHHCFDPKEL